MTDTAQLPIAAQSQDRLDAQCSRIIEGTPVEVVFGLPGDQIVLSGEVRVDSSDTAFVSGVIVGRMSPEGLVHSHLVSRVDLSAYDSTLAACRADIRDNERICSVLDPDVAWARSVRPAGFSNGYPTLDVVVLDDEHVQIEWECGLHLSPYPNTVFDVAEYVLVAAW